MFKLNHEVEMALFTEVVNLCPYDYYGQELADVWETISENFI